MDIADQVIQIGFAVLAVDGFVRRDDRQVGRDLGAVGEAEGDLDGKQSLVDILEQEIAVFLGPSLRHT